MLYIFLIVSQWIDPTNKSVCVAYSAVSLSFIVVQKTNESATLLR